MDHFTAAPLAQWVLKAQTGTPALREHRQREFYRSKPSAPTAEMTGLPSRSSSGVKPPE